MKKKNLIFSLLILLCLLLVPIVFSGVIEILIDFGTGINVELGSGTNITEGTIINLTGLNCILTVVGNHIVDNMQVSPNYVLFGTSLKNLTHTLDVPYNYSPEIKVLNITCSRPNTAANLFVNISDLNGIKIYEVSEPSNLTSVDWSSTSQNFSFTVNAPSGITSKIKVYWPFSSQPNIIECTAPPCRLSWDPNKKILALNATHSSPVKWVLHVQDITTTTISTTAFTTTTSTTIDSEKPRWGPVFNHTPQGPNVGQPVTINVDWSDNTNLDTVIIYENSTGVFLPHVICGSGMQPC